LGKHNNATGTVRKSLKHFATLLAAAYLDATSRKAFLGDRRRQNFRYRAGCLHGSSAQTVQTVKNENNHQVEGITMSTLKQRLHADVVVHMKDRNKTALTTVRNVLGEIETREKSGKTPIELDDTQVTALLQKEAAKRRDTARIYTEAGEAERAAAEIAEAEVIEAYLPTMLTSGEVEDIVDEAIAALKAGGTELSVRQMGAVMKPVTAKVAGRFDGKAVSEIVRNRLA
jgi:uncharacterized protein YqeY